MNEVGLDRLIRHSIALQRYSNGVVARMLGILRKADAELYAALVEALERAPETYTAARLESLLASVREINEAAYRLIGKELRDELAQFVVSESEFHQQFLLSAAPARVHIASVTPAQVYAAAYAQPFRISKGGAVPLAQYLAGLSAERAKTIRDAVALGWLEGQTTESIVRRIRGTKSAKFEDGLMQAPRRHIEGMVRTAVNHFSSFTQQRVFQANADLVKGWQFMATLDGRTSITCASLDGKTFDIGKGPVPPLHINCRSAAKPVLKTWREMGIDMPEMPAGQRASKGGPVDADVTFSQWLRKQPASVQDDVLGPTRGRLFRAGKVDVNAFTNDKGRVYTLAELRKRNAGLFERAGL